MKNYLFNLRLWWQGWSHFHEITDWKSGYGPDSWKWQAIYATNYLACCLVAAGAVEPLSGFMHRHRRGWFNDKVLDTIEVVDDQHGARAGRPLWGSVESAFWVRVAAPAFWIWLLWLLIW